ncbi:MAG TPA: cellulose biosynthesis cyclic di-GMP-binding regulatory protein BcsB, partial [Usitatibacter sp.]|nr:cellulose biosynthesis cyclic di-GMP-binding regulatory protein BcsB [Usitatibacter sp.]
MTIGEMIAVSRALGVALAAVAFSAAAATAPPVAPAKAGASASAAVPTITRNARFSQLGARSSLQLRGDGDSATLDFGCRSDELVTRATLRLRYVGSPALAPGVSHVRLALNGDTIATLPFSAATAGTLVERAVEVDPRLMIGFNKLTMTLVATPGSDAAPSAEAAPGLWADIAASSELDLTLQPLALADDLAILPEPFFDAHDQRRLVVPFAFGAKPSQATLRAAADVASWL